MITTLATIAAGWFALSLPAAVILGRSIKLADQQAAR